MHTRAHRVGKAGKAVREKTERHVQVYLKQQTKQCAGCWRLTRLPISSGMVHVSLLWPRLFTLRPYMELELMHTLELRELDEISCQVKGVNLQCAKFSANILRPAYIYVCVWLSWCCFILVTVTLCERIHKYIHIHTLSLVRNPVLLQLFLDLVLYRRLVSDCRY